MLAFIAAQIGGDPEAFEEYARRAETRREQDARQTPIGSTCATADESTPGLGARRCSAERSPPALPADRTARRGIAVERISCFFMPCFSSRKRQTRQRFQPEIPAMTPKSQLQPLSASRTRRGYPLRNQGECVKSSDIAAQPHRHAFLLCPAGIHNIQLNMESCSYR